MTQTAIDALEDLQEHIRALIVSEHITGQETGELRRIRDRLDTRLSAIRRGEALRHERVVPGNDDALDHEEEETTT
jgi:hypothetical protein